MKLFTVPMTCFAANCYVLVTEKNNGILIDPGAQGDKICAALKANKVNPVAILLTHAHFDHVGAVKTLLQEYPGITVYLCPKDIATIADTVERRALQWGLIDPQQYHIIPEKELNEGDIIEIDIPKNTINVLVSDEVLAERRSKWQPREPRITTGYLARYAKSVTSGCTGAVLK